MQKLFLYILVFLISSTAIAQNALNQQVAVYFEKDQAELSIEAQNKLTETLQSILNLESYSVKIEAHTDSDGSLTYNQLLSEKRANSVYEFLLLQGMKTQDLQIVAQGETDPAFSNQTERGQQKNRRVDVFFVSKSSQKQFVKAIPKLSSFKDLQRLTTTNTLQSFSISTHQEQKLEARKGTIVSIPANAFLLEDGSELPTNAQVQIKIQEAISLEDMLLNNLSTMSGDKILETAGMVKIEASYKGQNLQLKQGKNMEVKVPKNDINPEKEKEMELFYGVTQEGGAMDWKPTNEKVKTTKPHPLVEVDLTELENFESPKFPAPKLTGLQTVPEKPALIKKPYKPHAPKEPKKERFQFKPSTWQKLTLGRKKIDQMSEQKYEEAMQKYEQRKTDYDKNMAHYQKSMKSYEEAIERKKELEKQRENIIFYNIAVLSQYRRDVNTYREYLKSVLTTNHLKKYVQKNGLRGKSPKQVYNILSLKTEPRKGFPIGATFIAENLEITEQEAEHYFEKWYKKYRYEYRRALNQVKRNISNPDYLASLDKMLNILDGKYIEKKAEMGLMSDSEYSNYFTASVGQLGWINIDRWLKSQEMQEIFVAAEKDENTRFFAVSHTFNSCLGMWQNDGKTDLSIRLPVGEEFTIIGLKIENGKFQMADKSFEVTRKNVKIPLSFQQKSLADLRERVRDLDMKRSI